MKETCCFFGATEKGDDSENQVFVQQKIIFACSYKLQDIVITGRISDTVKFLMILYLLTSQSSRKTKKHRFSSFQGKET